MFAKYPLGDICYVGPRNTPLNKARTLHPTEYTAAVMYAEDKGDLSLLEKYRAGPRRYMQ